MVMHEGGKVKLHNLALSRLFSIPVISNVFQLNNIDPALGELLLNLNPGESKTVKIRREGYLKELLFRTAGYRERDRDYKLISVQDIKPQLDEKEMESWQKLIRILTHEITNSIGPINSTIDTIADFYITENEEGNKQLSHLSQKTIDDTVKGIGIIRERSSGLLDFVQQFRDLTLIPRPNPVNIPVRALFDHVTLLLKDNLESKKISLYIDVDPEDLTIHADKAMIEQVLINLLRNAAEAGGKNIRLEAGDEERTCLIKISDDGIGIREVEMDNIFVPFYTTKENGSGIGLSLTRQIMLLHGGTINVNSLQGKGSIFTLAFIKN